MVVLTKSFAVAAEDYADIVNILMKRVELLESRDSKYQNEIATLMAKIEALERSSFEREVQLLNELDKVNSKCTDLGSAAADNEGELAEDNQHNQQIIDDKGNNRIQRKISLIARQAVETEVAFYATHTQHDVHHLGKNSVIIFDQIVSNVGNAYSASQGSFVAPVDGVYVFHVTVMGQVSSNVSNNHFSAHIDVNGVPYSQLWVEIHDQSSQMFVTELEKGGVVSVKNRYEGYGIVGQHMSSFSGFLLYQHDPASAIVGK